MVNNKVHIQAVGSESTARLFENESLIRALLARRKVSVEAIQVFDRQDYSKELPNLGMEEEKNE